MMPSASDCAADLEREERASRTNGIGQRAATSTTTWRARHVPPQEAQPARALGVAHRRRGVVARRAAQALRARHRARPAPEFIAWRQLAALMARPRLPSPARWRAKRLRDVAQAAALAPSVRALRSCRPPQDAARPEREHQHEDQEREHDAVRRRVGEAERLREARGSRRRSRRRRRCPCRRR